MIPYVQTSTSTSTTDTLHSSAPKKRRIVPAKTKVDPEIESVVLENRQKKKAAKFQFAIQILDEFKVKHGGKLPSLRSIMKMLKVGFPKAHEILDEYARHCGTTVCIMY